MRTTFGIEFGGGSFYDSHLMAFAAVRALNVLQQNALKLGSHGQVELQQSGLVASAPLRLMAMYKGMYYEELPDFDQPEWVRKISGRERVRYHRKALRDSAAASRFAQSM